MRYIVPPSQLLELDITSLTSDEAWERLVKFLRPHVGRGDLRVPAGACRTGDRLRRSAGTGTVPCKFPRMTRKNGTHLAQSFRYAEALEKTLKSIYAHSFRPTPFQDGLGPDVLLPHCPLFLRRNLSAAYDSSPDRGHL